MIHESYVAKLGIKLTIHGSAVRHATNVLWSPVRLAVICTLMQYNKQ